MNSSTTATDPERDELTYSLQVPHTASFEMSNSTIASGGRPNRSQSESQTESS